MRIAVTSDTHSQDFEFPDADFFIHCGDITTWGTIEEVARFAQRLNASDYEAGAIVPGNHDGVFEHMPVIAEGLFDRRFRILVDRLYVWKGLRIYGSPWTPPFGSYSFMYEERRLRRVYTGIPKRLDFLVTHGPAKGILDQAHIRDERYEERRLIHIGSTELRTAVLNRDIRHHVFGHVHAQGGLPTLEYRPGRFATNCAATDIENGFYVMRRAPRLFEID